MTGPVIIIGAGIGGLSAAIHLKHSGLEVILLEQNEMVGGKMMEIQADGYRWDTGPSVITMRPVIEDLFRMCGRRPEDYIELSAVEPLTRYFFPDGSRFDISNNLSSTLSAIAKFGSREVEGYLKYLAYAARLHRITGPAFIYGDPVSLSILRKVPVTDVLYMDGLRTMHQAVSSFVRTSKMRQLLDRFATYAGSDPYRAPATLNVIGHVELSDGVWYPRGGIYTIAKAYARLARELGVDIRLNSRVRRILVREGRVYGVELDNGSNITADQVVSNLDVTTTLDQLLPDIPRVKRSWQRLASREYSCSGFIALLGVRKNFAMLAHHNIFFCSDYRREFQDIFYNQVAPQDPTIYLAITSKTDQNHAPDGCENWFILVNAPITGSKWNWRTQKHDYLQSVLIRLKQFGVDISAEDIAVQNILTPDDLQRNSGAWKGALYGPSSNSPFSAFIRPHNRSNLVKGLYFAGGTTHPGGGVPMVTLSGKVTARLVCRDRENV